MADTSTLKAVQVQLSSLKLTGYSGRLCAICIREVLPDLRPWSWFACENCRAVDRKVAALLGAKRLLPLGQHSIMNGLGIKISELASLQSEAAIDQLASMQVDWATLFEWEEHLARQHLTPWSAQLADGPCTIPLAEWQDRYPAEPVASAVHYALLLDRHYRWVFDVVPQAADVAWLAGIRE